VLPLMQTETITDSDIQFYREKGYLLLGPLMNADTVAQFLTELDGMPRRPEDKGTLFFTQKRGQNQALAKFAAEGPQVATMLRLIGPNLRCWFDQFVVKPPRENAALFPWHQDNGYNAPKPDNNVTVWIALDQTTLENGCIWIVPGSHKQGLIPHSKKSEASWHLEADPGVEGVPVLLEPGEAVAFSGYTLHRSLGNRTNGWRRAFFLEYCDADAVLSDGLPVNQQTEGTLFASAPSPVIAGVSRFD